MTDYKTLTAKIVHNYGGRKKGQLIKDLDELLRYYENNLTRTYLVKKVSEKPKTLRQFDVDVYNNKLADLPSSIDRIMKRKIKDSDKAMGILRLVKYFGGWQKITIIPKSLFDETWAIMEGLKNVELHPEEEGLFRVN